MILYTVAINDNDIIFSKEHALFYPIDDFNSDDRLLVEANERFPAAFKFYNVSDGKLKVKNQTYIYKHIKPMFEDLEENNIDLGISMASFYKIYKKPPLELIPKEGLIIYSYKNIEMRVYNV